MSQKSSVNKPVFITIISIAVLLIALVLGVVFYKYLSMNNRDTQRRNDVSRIVSQLASYQTEGGSISSFRNVGYWRASSPDNPPADICGNDTDPFISVFSKKYLCVDNKFESPTGENYRVLKAGSPLEQPGDITFTGSDCDSLKDTTKIAVRMKLERGEVCQGF